MEESMRQLAITLGLATGILAAGVVAWQAEAMVGAGSPQLSTAAKASSAVTPAACRGGGEHCPPGYVWNGNRCVPC
jgi:hypothetical protein